MTTPQPCIDLATLQRLFGQYLNDSQAELAHWTCEPLGFRPVNPMTGGLYRVSGTVRSAQGAEKPCSLVMKILVQSPQSPDQPGHWNYWKREALVYQSGLLEHLPAGLRAPRFAGTAEDPADPNRLFLFMEEVVPAPSHTWTTADHQAVAGLMGRFNASLQKLLPAPLPWMTTDWRHQTCSLGLRSMEHLETQGLWQSSWISEAFPLSVVERIRVVIEKADRLHALLDSMPGTICHFDAHGGNIIRPEGGSFVLFDWAQLGSGAVGEEIGHQFACNVMSGYADPRSATHLADLVESSYVEGLMAEGWQGARRQVRLAFAAASTLRGVVFMLPFILGLVSGLDPAAKAGAAQHLAQSTQALLPLADEALRAV